jgi:proteic killer suppression protein
MIKSWKHKGLKDFYETGSKKGIQSKHAKKLSFLLFQLTTAISPYDMNTPGNGFHKLIGNLDGHYAVKVSGNWRVIFQFQGKDAILVDYLDYH